MDRNDYQFVGTQVTRREKQLIQEAAKNAQITVSQYIRRSVLGSDNEIYEKSPAEMQEMLTLSEFAVYISVSRTTARRILKEGDVPYTRVHGMYRISRGSAEEYLSRERSYFNNDSIDKESCLTLSEAARFLRLSPQTVTNYVHSGKIPAYRVNKQYRFKLDELEQYLQSTRTV